MKSGETVVGGDEEYARAARVEYLLTELRIDSLVESVEGWA